MPFVKKKKISQHFFSFNNINLYRCMCVWPFKGKAFCFLFFFFCFAQISIHLSVGMKKVFVKKVHFRILPSTSSRPLTFFITSFRIFVVFLCLYTFSDLCMQDRVLPFPFLFFFKKNVWSKMNVEGPTRRSTFGSIVQSLALMMTVIIIYISLPKKKPPT